MSTINWTKIANTFADYEDKRDQWRDAQRAVNQVEVAHVERLLQDALRALPSIIEIELKNACRLGRPPAEWLHVWSWFQPHMASAAVGDVLKTMLHDQKIRTKQEQDSEGSSNPQETLLYANVADLKARALEHVNQPPVSPAGRAKK